MSAENCIDTTRCPCPCLPKVTLEQAVVDLVESIALQEKDVYKRQALLVSPVVDMEALITNMMQCAHVTEEQLQRAGEILSLIHISE